VTVPNNGTYPYYDQDGITIYHGDCRNLIDLQADVMITDPPYGIGLIVKSSGYKGYSLPQASVTYQDDPAYVTALARETVPAWLARVDRAVIFSGPAAIWDYPPAVAIGCVYCPAGAGRSPWGFQGCHPILYYGKDPFLQDGKGGRPSSFRTEQPNPDKFDHPSPKPLSWMTWAVNRASRPGELVIDPFMGSGTTLVAAKKDHRRAIGIEIEERYCEIAAKRLDQGVLDLAYS
jgi:site-specific DNA-methyltransferase (adenine-specific)